MTNRHWRALGLFLRDVAAHWNYVFHERKPRWLRRPWFIHRDSAFCRCRRCKRQILESRAWARAWYDSCEHVNRVPNHSARTSPRLTHEVCEDCGFPFARMKA